MFISTIRLYGFSYVYDNKFLFYINESVDSFTRRLKLDSRSFTDTMLKVLNNIIFMTMKIIVKFLSLGGY